MIGATRHGGLTRERWTRLSLADQLANIGAEVARAARARSVGNERRLEQHLDLALELFEFTLDDERWRAQRFEIARVRELVCDFLAGPNEFGSSAESMDAYFLPFLYLTSAAKGEWRPHRRWTSRSSTLMYEEEKARVAGLRVAPSRSSAPPSESA